MITEKDELKTRVEAKRAELEARIKNAQADAQGTSRDQIEKLEQKLDSMKQTVQDGWDNLSDAAVHKLNEFLRDDRDGASS